MLRHPSKHRQFNQQKLQFRRFYVSLTADYSSVVPVDCRDGLRTELNTRCGMESHRLLWMTSKHRIDVLKYCVIFLMVRVSFRGTEFL